MFLHTLFPSTVCHLFCSGIWSNIVKLFCYPSHYGLFVHWMSVWKFKLLGRIDWGESILCDDSFCISSLTFCHTYIHLVGHCKVWKKPISHFMYFGWRVIIVFSHFLESKSMTNQLSKIRNTKKMEKIPFKMCVWGGGSRLPLSPFFSLF